MEIEHSRLEMATVCALYALFAEAFSGPIVLLHSFQKPMQQDTGTTIEIVCRWYLDNIVKDVSGEGVLFAPNHKCFRSARSVRGYFAASVTHMRKMKAFVRMFSQYGVDKLDGMIREHTAALLNCKDKALRSNSEALEEIASRSSTNHRRERESGLKLVNFATFVGFCIQAGKALEFGRILAKAVGVLEEVIRRVLESLLASEQVERLSAESIVARYDQYKRFCG